jgi:hypothetical protein
MPPAEGNLRRVRGRAIAGISVSLGVLLIPILYFLAELIFGASIPDLAARWDTLPRWQQTVCGIFVLAVFAIGYLVLMLRAGE